MVRSFQSIKPAGFYVRDGRWIAPFILYMCLNQYVKQVLTVYRPIIKFLYQVSGRVLTTTDNGCNSQPCHVYNVFEAGQLRLNKHFVYYTSFFIWPCKLKDVTWVKKSLIIFLLPVIVTINVYSIVPCFVVYEYFRFLWLMLNFRYWTLITQIRV